MKAAWTLPYRSETEFLLHETRLRLRSKSHGTVKLKTARKAAACGLPALTRLYFAQSALFLSLWVVCWVARMRTTMAPEAHRSRNYNARKVCRSIMDAIHDAI